MAGKLQIPQKVTALLVYGRPPLVFGGMLCALTVMWTKSPELYTLGVTLLIISMSFDIVDGWFAARFTPHETLAHLADRIMDKVVYAMIFPLVSVGMMWRLLTITPGYPRIEMLHVIFVLILTVVVLLRDNFAHFMRSRAGAKGPEPEPSEFTRLRTAVAAPVGVLLYARAFYVPEGPSSFTYYWISWMGNIPLRGLFFIEILFLIINLGSLAGYCRKYGAAFLDELCLGDELLRRKILSVFPNALTVMNAVMGMLAVFFAYQGRIREAYLLLMGAATFDKLDGAVARKLGLTEPLPGEAGAPKSRINVGAIMDDIADGISFCIVPAWIFFIALSSVSDMEGLRWLPIGLIAMVYAAAGIARLIYFTLDTSPIPGFFKGLPTPAAALLVTAPLIMLGQAVEGNFLGWVRFWALFTIFLMIMTSVLMNFYPIRYLHAGRLMSRKPWVGRISLFVIVATVFTPFFGHVSLLLQAIYLFSPFFTRQIPSSVAASESASSGEDQME